ncbi:transglutaminaseTgpA domain-containing protein [Herbiconiux sp. KACC 21604]|uniref:transglutaminaseTgpA domain-containing protein n=1 Tax=unclassified Herbiconiux TaxID=2618217 RepID=UPI0020A2F0C5|nr:transglutaminaseTgpA domain-containing protein [Herbiconiux sp. SALV-R1]WPO88689.1 transglutaminaseTgpA domain-containing protein [Herbiconiux sp. KACC 21604]
MRRAEHPRPDRRYLVTTALAFGAMLVVAASVWWPVYASVSFVVMVAVTVTSGVALTGVAAARSWPAPVVLGAGVLLWLLLGVPLAVPSRAIGGVLPSGAGLADLVVTTASGWRQLLTIEPPVGSYQALLVPCYSLLLLASVLVVSIATRTRRPVLALLCPGAVVVAALVFGGPPGPAPALSGAVLAVLALGWLALGLPTRVAAAGAARPGRPRPPVRAALGALMGVAVVAGLVAGGVSALPSAHRAAARDAVVQQFDASQQSSPLAAYRAYLKAPLADSVVLGVTGAQPGDRVVVARLDDYDGVVFGVGPDEHFDRVAGRLPGGARGAPSTTESGGSGPSGGSADGAGGPVEVVVQVGEYSGVWVPTVGDPRSISFGGDGALQNELFYDGALGMPAVSGGLAPGDSYTLEAVGTTAGVADPGAEGEALGALTPAAPVGALPAETPDAVTTRLAEWAPADRSPGARLAGVVAGLRSGYLSGGGGDGRAEGTGGSAVGGADRFARSGHGADRLEELLTASPMLGDDEQYAAAGALLAQAVGFPARVVFGFVVPEPGADPSADPSTADPSADPSAGPAIEVRGRDVAAWIEVDTAEAGWVPLDVTPEPRPVPESPVDDSALAVQPPVVVPPASGELSDPLAQAASESDDDAPDAETGLPLALRILLIVGLALTGLAVLAAPFLTVIVLKARRRERRRRTGPARGRATGAWAELTDAARDLAVELPPASTRSQAAGALGGTDAVTLALLVDTAAFAPDDPTEEEIDTLWLLSDRERRRLLAGRGIVSRLRSRVSLRSVRTYHGRDRKRRDVP